MQPLRRSLSLPFLIGGLSLSALAQQHHLTDAERVDLAGPVKSVSTETTRTDVVWSQPGGPTLAIPIWCQECEFDANGNRTRFGQRVDGRFQGEVVRLLFDGQGHVTERVAEDASTGATIRREVVGPFGNMEEFHYNGGKLQSHVVFAYDEYGHRIDWLTLDGPGNQKARTVVNTDKEGNYTEQWDRGKEGEFGLYVRQTVDPRTHIEQFTSFDASGAVALTWTFKDRKLSYYWQLPGSRSQFGDGFSEDIGDDTFATYQCHSDGSCDRARVHYVYFDAKRRNPQSVEWRDESGQLLYGAYYDYEIDACRNWTHRVIRVWSQSLAERKLYEADSRTISYWPQ